MALEDERREWVARVLGFAIPRGTGAPAEIVVRPGAARAPPPIAYVSVQGRALWQDARDVVNDQVSALQGYLRTLDDPDLRQIADHGLGALTKRLGTELVVALIEVDAAPGAAPARERAVSAVTGYRQFLQQDPLVRLLEENPFGVPVTIRATLGRALDQIERALSR
jgi:hypothetical protein